MAGNHRERGGGAGIRGATRKMTSDEDGRERGEDELATKRREVLERRSAREMARWPRRKKAESSRDSASDKAAGLARVKAESLQDSASSRRDEVFATFRLRVSEGGVFARLRLQRPGGVSERWSLN